MTNDSDPSIIQSSKPSPKSRLMMIAQGVGFLGSLAALGWAVSVALKQENREQLSKLSEATAGELFVLMSLAAISVAFNGLLFWVVLRPVRKLPPTDVIAVNAISTLLAYLPFKLSIVARFVIHNRRDKIAVLTIGAWIVAVTFLILAVIGPITIASLLLKEINPLWWTISLLGAGSCTLIGSIIARKLCGEVGLKRIGRLLGSNLGPRVIENESFAKVHLGFEMLGDLQAAMLGNLFRVLDILSFAMRFYVAARVLDLPISPSDSLLLGVSYFLIGLASPVGMLGTREAGTIAIASMVGISSGAIAETNDGQTPIVIAVLFVTAIESVVNLGCAGFGIIWLRLRPGTNRVGTEPKTED